MNGSERHATLADMLAREQEAAFWETVELDALDVENNASPIDRLWENEPRVLACEHVTVETLTGDTVCDDCGIALDIPYADRRTAL